MNGTLRPARASDYEAVCALLSGAGLPLAGLPPDLPHFIVAEHGGRIAAAAGMESYGSAVLLRSVVVDASIRGTGMGQRLVERVLDSARASGARDVFLLTTTAAEWFPRFGFVAADRADVPEAMRASAEFRGACPASASLMRLPLGRTPPS